MKHFSLWSSIFAVEDQFIWEDYAIWPLGLQAFPAGSGPTDRTTYMFSYLDATPSRPLLEEMLEDYWDLMPDYQVEFSIYPCCPHFQILIRFFFMFNADEVRWLNWSLQIVTQFLRFAVTDRALNWRIWKYEECFSVAFPHTEPG